MNAPTEIPLKQWLAEEGARLSLTPQAIHMRVQRRMYPKLKIRHVNKRVVFVRL